MPRQKIKEILYILPLALIIGVTPLLVHYRKIKLGDVVASYWIRDFNTDFFSYYKMLFFLGAVLLAAAVFYIYLKKGNKLKKTFYYIPLTVYTVMIIISTVLSECKFTALYGFPDRYEGMPVLLGYLLVVIITLNLVVSKRQLKFLLSILLISAVIIGLIGFYQFFGYDFFRSSPGQGLILPSSGGENLTEKLDYRFAERNIIYATFYNPNYAGSYFAMLFMLTLVMYLFAATRQEKMVYGSLNLLMFACWLGSLSRAGMLGVLVSLVLTGLLLKDIIKSKWRELVIITICFLLVFSFMDIFSGGKLRREFFSLGQETKLAVEGKATKIREIRTDGKVLYFNTEAGQLKLGFTATGDLLLRDGDNNILNYSPVRGDDPELKGGSPVGENGEKEFLRIDGQNYKDFRLRVVDNENKKGRLLELYYGSKKARFLIDENNNFWIIGMRGNIYPIAKVRSRGFTGRENLASGRGYIWSRSLPLLEKTLYKGFGPDSFAIYFPQHDAVGKLKTFGTAAKIVDKPHNLYLQIALNTGLISLLAVMVLFGMYFIRSLQLYRKNNYDSWFARAGVGIFGAFTAYAVAGIFNDSVVSVAPVFWTLLGMGIMIELKLRNRGSAGIRDDHSEVG